jgi:alkanesulfonate monooxygenase SsuD/methylene tetrahydromethanopterin reductase-like flavin-dependent oxidoreductase (luciferase family)
MGEMPMEEGEWPRYFVGTPALVREKLEQMARELGIGELIVNTIVWDQAKRLRSYELLAEEFGSPLIGFEHVEKAYPRG